MPHRNSRNGNFAPQPRRANHSIDLARELNSSALTKSKPANVFVKLFFANAESKLGCPDVARFDQNVAHAQVSKGAMIMQVCAAVVPKAVFTKKGGIRGEFMLVEGGGRGNNLESGTGLHHVDDGPVFHFLRLCLRPKV